jgi:hypothetical protein
MEEPIRKEVENPQAVDTINQVESSPKEEPAQEKNDFKVVGTISAFSIKTILRVFTWKDVRCVEVELVNGRRCNMKEEEVKRVNPMMLLEFLES